ncbi:MAG: LysR family transcriptional regulator [Arenicella sp.]
MKHDLPSLDSLKVFEAAARHLSFSLAANELCLSKGAVSHQIRKLESDLDCSLFNRTVRQVYLTKAGQELFKTTQSVFQDLRDQFVQFNNNQQNQVITFAISTYAAARWLSRNIADFIEQHPEISIVLHHSVNSKDFKLSEVDLALRWCRCKGENSSNRLAEAALPMFPVCSPKLIERFGYSANTQLPHEALLQPPWSTIPLLCEDQPQDFWFEWATSFNLQLVNSRRTISDSNVRVQAAVDEQGWMLADELMANELDNNLLVSPFKACLTGHGYALLRQPSQIVSHKAQLLSDWLTEKLNQTQNNLRHPS